MLALEEHVVVFPEPALVESAFGRLRRLRRIPMNLNKREVANHVLDSVTVFLKKLGVRLLEMARAEGALVVRELHDGHWRVRRATKRTRLAREVRGRGAPGSILAVTGGRQEAFALVADVTPALGLTRRQANAEGEGDRQAPDQPVSLLHPFRRVIH